MKQYYIISLKHTSKGDTALTFWGANSCGYTWDKNRAGIYSEDGMKSCVADDNVAVPIEVVDKFWMKALDFKDEYLAVPNNPTVLFHLGITNQLMKPKKFASCRMVFLNTAVNNPA